MTSALPTSSKDLTLCGHAGETLLPIPSPLLGSHVGGRPGGLPRGSWPRCKSCGRRMNFVAQVDLRKSRFEKTTYAWAYVFVCNGYDDEPNGSQCQTWDPTAGATAVVLTSPRPWWCWVMPVCYLAPQKYPTRVLYFRSEAEVDRANEHDPLSEALEDENAAPDQPLKFCVSIDWRAPVVVRMPAAPEWVQDDQTPACSVCREAMRLLFELNSDIRVGAMDQRGYWLPFGDAGRGYAFACANDCRSGVGTFFWQTT